MKKFNKIYKQLLEEIQSTIKPFVFIFGESHYIKEDRDKISAAIIHIKPKFLLHELLYEDVCLSRDIIDKRLKNCHSGETCDPKLNKDIYRLGYDLNIKLIGIDYDELPDDLSTAEKFEMRETRFVKKIREYMSSGEVIVVVVGDTHLRTIKTKEFSQESLIIKSFYNDDRVKIIRSENGEIA